MNRATIIGNLTFSPELKTVQNGVSVCTFNVAVNRRRKEGQEPEADFFRVTAWRQLGENCAKYLSKGRKVAVTGPVSGRAYMGKDGTPKFSLEITADDVEFLSPKNEQPDAAAVEQTANAITSSAPAAPAGFVDVTDDQDLPF